MFSSFSRAKGKQPTGQPHPIHPGWPEYSPLLYLKDGAKLQLRPLNRRDGRTWCESRLVDEAWLRPVEPTASDGWDTAHNSSGWRQYFMSVNLDAREGRVVPFVIEVDGHFAGQVTLGNIQHGSVSDCWIGYWVTSPNMGRGVATAACALGIDHAFARIGLHRVTATYLESNPASGQVLVSNGMKHEGTLRKNLHIDGQWRDHEFMAIVRDDFPVTAVERLRRQGRIHLP